MTLIEELRQLINDHHAHGLRAIDTTTLTQLVHKWSHPSQSVTIYDEWANTRK